VAGDADILLVPNSETGNVFYKTLTQFPRTKVAGMLSGARCPVIVTSRSDTEEVKFRTLGLAVRSILAAR
jgi:phosphate butyryltransferase